MDTLKDRVKSFLWRAGLFTAVSVFGYLMNVGDVRSIDPWKLLTIFTVTISTFVVNEITKHANDAATAPAVPPDVALDIQ